MSRKALFSNVNVNHEERAPSRMRMRPILGSPDLIPDEAARPVGAISQSLGEANDRAKRAEEIERRLTEGQVIIEIDPELVEPSFVSDRMPVSEEALASLAEKIRDYGQLNPILVRPVGNRYQVAFGHRRLRAVKALGGKVKAVVRNLSDEELVIAQGQENHEREDLSFIEKCMFARRLESRGFSRTTIIAAMSIYKSDLSNMISVANKIPEEIVAAIGPAPGVGRRGWIELSEFMSDPRAKQVIQAAIADPSFARMDSDSRFKKVAASTKAQPQKPRVESWTFGGRPIAKVTEDADRVVLAIDRRKSPEFAAFVLTRLQALYSEFEAKSSE
jgi:ParB family chromosome partitioning protein